MIFYPNLEYGWSSKLRSESYPDLGMDYHQNQGLDLIQTWVWCFIKNQGLDLIQTWVWIIIKIKVWILSRPGYGLSSKSRSGSYPDLSMMFHQKSRSGSYPDLGMDYHQNQGLDLIQTWVWIIIKIKVWILSRPGYGWSSKSRSGSYPDLGMNYHQNQGLDLIQTWVWMIIKI